MVPLVTNAWIQESVAEVDAILHRDYPVIQAIILLFSGIYVVINLIVDLTYTFLDPRIRY